MLAFVWLLESSGPSSVCFQGSVSGTMRSAAMVMSVRTSGSKFSLSVSEAEVCWMKRVRRPILTPLRPGAISASTSRVTRWQPLPREGSVNVFCQGIVGCVAGHEEREEEDAEEVVGQHEAHGGGRDGFGLLETRLPKGRYEGIVR